MKDQLNYNRDNGVKKVETNTHVEGEVPLIGK